MSLELRSKVTNHQAGVDAEKSAGQFLNSLGYSTLATRYKTKAGEIDIIVSNANELLFVEVKRRKSGIIDDPITSTQKKRIINAALQYLSENPQYNNLDMRFDCIIVNKDLNIEHIKDSWRIEEI